MRRGDGGGGFLWVVVLLFLALAGAGGAAVVVTTTEQQRKVRQAARRQAARFGVKPELLEAIGYVETRWRLGLVNRSGADGERGGSYGPFQLSEKTARAYGYTGSMDAIKSDADLAAEWAARILAKRPGGPPATIEDAAAWWNGGKTSAAALGAKHMTRVDYIPKAQAALAKVTASPVAAA